MRPLSELFPNIETRRVKRDFRRFFHRGAGRNSWDDTSLDLGFMSGALDPSITFARASSATYFDASGTLQTAATNAARFDNDPTSHAPLGLLIEEQRTNVLLNSATLGTQSVAVTAQSAFGKRAVRASATMNRMRDDPKSRERPAISSGTTSIPM